MRTARNAITSTFAAWDSMRVLACVLVALIVLIQYPLWISKKGSWFRVWDLDRQVTVVKEQTRKLQARNDTLEAEVRDLKIGFEAIEERARLELGMVRADETFFQFPVRTQPHKP